MTDPRWQRVLATVTNEMNRLPIPGVAVGVIYGDTEEIAGLGVTNVEHPLAVTPETLFQIGSITKTFVATLVLRLAQLNKVDLDAPLRTYLPGLELRDAQAARHATLRNCLMHTGGWLGDYFDDFGRGEEALDRLVAAMARLPQLTPLGQVWSYNNAGFYLAGAVIQHVLGKPFERSMQEYVFDPLEMRSSYFFAEDVVTHRFVVGHEGQNGKPVIARPWALARAAGAAGGIISNVGDLFRYARMYLRRGASPSGLEMLSPESLAAMEFARIPTIDPEGVGLSWFVQEIDGVKFMGHGGATKGQTARLMIAPQHGFATVILTNSASGTTLINATLKTILSEYLQVKVPTPAAIERPQAELAEYMGTYEAALDRVELRLDGSDVWLQVTLKGGFPTPNIPPPAAMPPPVRAVFYDRDRILLLDDPYYETRCEFLRDGDGRIEWLRIFGRIHKRGPSS